MPDSSGSNCLTPKGDLLTADLYNKAFSMHGVIMVFFFLVPSIPATLGNFLMPIMIGAKDLAFPRINLISWYLYVVGGLIAITVLAMGGIDTGWTFYTPYSTIGSTTNVSLAIVGVFVAGFSSILTGFNFIVTVHRMRAPGMTWFRLPLFVWANYATSLVMILGTPVVAITLTMIAAERTLHLGIFDPKLGGDPVLMQHLFWFLLTPGRSIYIHDPARHGRDERARVRDFAQARCSATASSPLRASRSPSSAFSCGATTSSSAASRFTPAWSSRSSRCSWLCRRP